ncbi:MAG: SMC-Scp complex subunit ScpB, partial [Anaerolineales bacterium]|nr:SMC-Scp complex subunit ScpB [Anaerolineales bacterium]
KENRGVAILTHNDHIQLVTRADFSPLLEKVMKAELNESLTNAALETLSVIAYAGPISRAEIDYIRGVNSSFILRSLLLRGLIEREADPKRANAFLYTPSANFLQHLGLKNFNELPEFEKFRALAAEVKNPPKIDTNIPMNTNATNGNE